jgi:RES domain-containing protein
LRLWRISSARRARDLDGGYGLANNGRWNTRGRPVTYCSTVPSLAALEKRVHVLSPSLLPPQNLVAIDVPDDAHRKVIAITGLPPDWTFREAHTQALGDAWLDAALELLLFVPSVILPFADVPEQNVLINHRAAGAGRVSVAEASPFTLDPRLFSP